MPLDIERLAALLEEQDQAKAGRLGVRLQQALTKLFEPRIGQVLKIIESLTTERYEHSVQIKELDHKTRSSVDRFQTLV